jgi:hypothetical protein
VDVQDITTVQHTMTLGQLRALLAGLDHLADDTAISLVSECSDETLNVYSAGPLGVDWGGAAECLSTVQIQAIEFSE